MTNIEGYLIQWIDPQQQKTILYGKDTSQVRSGASARFLDEGHTPFPNLEEAIFSFHEKEELEKRRFPRDSALELVKAKLLIAHSYTEEESLWLNGRENDRPKNPFVIVLSDEYDRWRLFGLRNENKQSSEFHSASDLEQTFTRGFLDYWMAVRALAEMRVSRVHTARLATFSREPVVVPALETPVAQQV